MSAPGYVRTIANRIAAALVCDSFAIRNYFSSSEKASDAQAEKLLRFEELAEHAVSSEPVSVIGFPVKQGKLGNFIGFGAHPRASGAKYLGNQYLSAPLPTVR